MAKVNLSIPKGTRDFIPEQMARRNYIFSILKEVFEIHGFQPIETPSMENLSTLLGKYGEEGDKLLFRILNSGDFMKKVPQDSDHNTNSLISHVSEKGLRYDLTVPFARFVVMHQNELNFPFRRYQIQPVWRADRPQRGRYREFFQCDVDVIGTRSMMEEANLIKIIDEAFEKMGVRVAVKLNNRKILQGIAESVGAADNFIDFTVALDKLDKIGWDKVFEELNSKGIDSNACNKIKSIVEHGKTNAELPDYLRSIIGDSEVALKGIEEMEQVFEYLAISPSKCEVEFDLTLARGLNYYTGAIFEVKALDVNMGSICGGGRYDDLTGIFGMPDVSGVGISFGADRIYDVMHELDLFPDDNLSSSKVLFINFGADEEKSAFKLAYELRKNGIAAEVYPDSAKLKKQFSYADQKKIAYTIMQGSEERTNGVVQIKNMKSGEQTEVAIENLSEFPF
ncbi:MAG: histidine--tRNA ligase [Marinilabiliales bacterium]|nr:MAG: histidine--tRNA ligase [Marinilabiliales bacterium]